MVNRITINTVSLVQPKSKASDIHQHHSSKLSGKYVVMLNLFLVKYKIQLTKIVHYLDIPIKYYSF